MPIAVSTTEAAATLARHGHGLGNPPPDLTDPHPHRDESALARTAMARASLGLFLSPETRGALTSEQHLQICARAGHEAMRARRGGYSGGVVAGFRNVPEVCP